jgi:hypothetical protein
MKNDPDRTAASGMLYLVISIFVLAPALAGVYMFAFTLGASAWLWFRPVTLAHLRALRRSRIKVRLAIGLPARQVLMMTAITRTERQTIYEQGRTAASFDQSVVVSPYLHDEERFAVWLEGYRSVLRRPE